MAETDIMQVDSLSAQQSVIGSMLIDDRCVGVVLSMLMPEDFTDGSCRNTFRAIKKLFAEGKPVDPITILDAVQGGDRFAQWERELMDLTPTAANVEAYADIVKRQTALSRLKEQADKLTLVTNLDEARKIVQMMNGFLSAGNSVHTWTAAELAQNFIQRMTSKDKPEYLPWGFPTADREVFAELGDMILLGGYASAGKTLLSIQMALAQAKKYRVGYYTLETQPEKMADRLFARMAKIPLRAIKERDFTDSSVSRMANAANQFVTEAPIEFTHATKWTVEDIASHALSRGYQIIYVDYLQIVGGRGNLSEYDHVSMVSTDLKAFGQANKVAVVALAQLSRSKETKAGDKIPPDMHSFRSSGQIEQDADAAFLLWTEDPNDNRANRVLKLGKNKEGEKFTRSLAFDGATQTMVEIEEQPDHTVAAQLAAAGRAAKRANRTNSGQVQFRELRGGDQDNPFV